MTPSGVPSRPGFDCRFSGSQPVALILKTGNVNCEAIMSGMLAFLP